MLITIYFNESIHNGLAAANRILNYAKGVNKTGNKVVIIMPFNIDLDKKYSQNGIYENVEYEYLSSIGWKPKNKVYLPFYYFHLLFNRYLGDFKMLSYNIYKKDKSDVVYLYKFSTFFSILLLLVNFNRKKVSELCEIPYFNETGFKRQIHLFFRETFLFPLFDGFVVISENLMSYIEKHKSSKATLIKVPILVNKEENLSEEIESSRIPYIIHNADITYEEKDGVFEMINAFGIASKKINFPVNFIITSSLNKSPVKDKIKNYLEKENLTNSVIFTGYLPRKELISLQKNASMAILNKKFNLQNLYCFPTKLGEYLLNEIPIIATKVGEMSNFLKHENTALLFDDGNVEDIAKNIEKLFTNSELAKLLAKNGRNLAESEFNIESQGKRLEIYFENLINNK
jgi:glycosyltransferase involved in cell wall biosynthesis